MSCENCENGADPLANIFDTLDPHPANDFLDVAGMLSVAPDVSVRLSSDDIVCLLAGNPIARNVRRLLQAGFVPLDPVSFVSITDIERAFSVMTSGASMSWIMQGQHHTLITEIDHTRDHFFVDDLFSIDARDETSVETICAAAREPYSDPAYARLLAKLGLAQDMASFE